MFEMNIAPGKTARNFTQIELKENTGIAVLRVVEKNTQGQIISQGLFPLRFHDPDACAFVKLPNTHPEKLLPAMVFDDMHGSPFILCNIKQLYIA